MGRALNHNTRRFTGRKSSGAICALDVTRPPATTTPLCLHPAGESLLIIKRQRLHVNHGIQRTGLLPLVGRQSFPYTASLHVGFIDSTLLITASPCKQGYTPVAEKLEAHGHHTVLHWCSHGTGETAPTTPWHQFKKSPVREHRPSPIWGHGFDLATGTWLGTPCCASSQTMLFSDADRCISQPDSRALAIDDGYSCVAGDESPLAKSAKLATDCAFAIPMPSRGCWCFLMSRFHVSCSHAALMSCFHVSCSHAAASAGPSECRSSSAKYRLTIFMPAIIDHSSQPHLLTSFKDEI